MTDHKLLQFRDPEAAPTDGMLEHILGDSYAAYEVLQEALLKMDMEQESPMVHTLQGMVC